MNSDVSPILSERRGHLGVLTLNRPRSINALDLTMVRLMRDALDAWVDDGAISAVLVLGAGDRGLCSGGDIVGLYKAAREGNQPAAASFWSEEYSLNLSIAEYPKPYVAFMDGIVLGGGVGISAHGSHRIVTERTRLGMPETGIGYVPDVGGTRLLAHAPGELGTHVGLTGITISGADAIGLGLADTFVQSARLGELAEALESGQIDDAVASVASTTPSSELAESQSWIDLAYAGNDLQEIIMRLKNGADGAQVAARRLADRSPTALAITLASLRIAAKEPSLGDALRREYGVSMHMLGVPDFAEGIRAQVIDKDRQPSWTPRTIGDIDPRAVVAALNPTTHQLQFR